MSDQESPENAKQILDRATPEQVRWVIARLGTKTDQEAARLARLHPSTVSKWPNKADLDKAVNLLLQDVAEAATLTLKQATPDAARTLVSALRGKDAVKAATAILDRAGFAPKQGLELTGKDGAPIQVIGIGGVDPDRDI